jgi:hypothetical protein
MKRLAAVYGGDSRQHRSLNEPKYKQHFSDIIYFPDLERVNLESYDGLLFPSQLHQKLLLRSKKRITDYLDQGGTVIAFGPQAISWLPGLTWEFRPINFTWWLDKDVNSGLVQAREDHSLFQYINLADTEWHFHGVFWPPKGVDVLFQSEDRGAIFYIDRVSTKGTILLTTLDPMFHFGSHFMPATERFLDGFLPWVIEEL